MVFYMTPKNWELGFKFSGNGMVIIIILNIYRLDIRNKFQKMC